MQIKLLCWRQMINMRLNHGQMKWNKSSVTRLSQAGTSWSFSSLSEVDCIDLYLYSWSLTRSETEFDKFEKYHDTQEQDNGSIRSDGIAKSVFRNVLHSENSCGQPNDESIRIWKKKSILSSWWRRTWRKLLLLGWRWRRWRRRLFGRLRRCILDLGWQWLLLVSDKIPTTRKGKGKGRQGRRFLRSRTKGKGKRKGKSHLAGGETYRAQDEWQGNETENWNEPM